MSWMWSNRPGLPGLSGLVGGVPRYGGKVYNYVQQWACFRSTAHAIMVLSSDPSAVIVDFMIAKRYGARAWLTARYPFTNPSHAVVSC
jgi:hypothetical protein